MSDDNEHYFSIPNDYLTYFSKNPLSKFMMVTEIGLFPRAKRHFIIRNEGIEEAIFIYCHKGLGSYSIDGSESRVVNPGQILLLSPGVPHAYSSSAHDPWTIFWMHIKGSFINSFQENWIHLSGSHSMKEMKSPPELTSISETLGDQIIDIFNQCFSILKMPYQLEEYFHLCQLCTTIISIIPIANKRAVNHLTDNGIKGIETAISFMKSHLHENINLEELAAAACFSPSHLSHLFHKSSGYSPIEYFLRMKIQAAAGDVFFSDQSIGDIARAYGFDDQYYFSRLFKRITGLSPMHYRKNPRMFHTKPVPVIQSFI